MKTIHQAAKEYCGCDNVGNCDCGFPENECWSKIKYDAFMDGAQFAQQWISIDYENPMPKDFVLIKYTDDVNDEHTGVSQYYANNSQKWSIPGYVISWRHIEHP
jgi:hypothetical protein